MKKLIFSIFALLFLISVSIFASVNGERLVDVNSPVWEAVKSLYITQGHALPSSAGPWSESEIALMLSALKIENMTEGEKETLSWVKNELKHDEDAFSFGLDASLELYTHLDNEYFTSRARWGEKDETKPFLTIFSDAWVGQNFYGYFSILLANAKLMVGNKNGEKYDSFGSTNFSSNVPIVPPATIKDLDFEFPHKAYLSAGGKNWNVAWGKYNLSWGPGTTGNLVLGDQLKKHNALRVTAFNKSFKYSFLLDSFTHPMNYYTYDTSNPDKSGYHGDMKDNLSTQEQLHGIKLFMAHRLEWRVFSDKLNIALTEGLMYMSEENNIDLSILNPSMLWHNLYTRAHSNSILSLEADWTIINGLNLYGEIVVDENVLPGENVPGKKGNGPAEPSAMGYLAGITYAMPLKKGILSFNAEGAYTDPFLYLRDGGKQSENEYRHQEKGQYGINFVVALRDIYNTGGGVQYTEEFLGYRYGGDAVVGNLNAKYTEYGKWNAEANLFFMAHGTFDQWTVWTRINPDEQHPNYPETSPSSPTNKHITDNHKDPNARDRDSIEYTFDITLKGELSLNKNLSLYGKSDYILVINPGNLSRLGKKQDLQLTLGLSYVI